MNEEDRRKVYDDIVGQHEIAMALGVSVYRVKRWLERKEATNCPRPVRVINAGHLYSLREWMAWFALWKITRGSETWNRKNGPPVRKKS